MTLKNRICLIWISALMVASSLCEAAQEDTPGASHHKPIKASHSPAATPYGANLSEAESLRALESEIARKLGSNIRESDYPEEARREGWSGTALVDVLVGRGR